MDNANQNQGKTSLKQQADVNSFAQPVSPVPLGSLNKEHELIAVSPPNSEVVVRPSDVEPKIVPEVSETGVETVSDKPSLGKDHSLAGLTLSPSATIPPTVSVSSPFEDEKEARWAQKRHPIMDSIRWLAALFLKKEKKG